MLRSVSQWLSLADEYDRRVNDTIYERLSLSLHAVVEPAVGLCLMIVLT